uniref:V-set and transmembrane domain containing 4a n=1 Tax=Oryzias melastigma TaxID=30732 RepID=A0A3B3CZV5_ORYME
FVLFHLAGEVLKAPAEVCQALNVTVTPGPVVLVTEKDNLTLSCLVSQKKRSTSFLILRWFFSPLPFPSPFLIVKTGIRKLKLYGNYTRRFPHPKFHLHDEEGGEMYRLLILNLTGMDQGFYSCKVQEIRKYRNTWRSSSNGTSTIQLKGKNQTQACPESRYIYLFIYFTLSIKDLFSFSSGETVTSSSSCSSSSPRPPRRENGQNTKREMPLKPKLPEEPPIYIPPKEESLTYAELELVRPRKELPRSSSPEPTDPSPDTVYAQILFQENHL